MPFKNCPPVLGEALTERGYSELTPVQTSVLADDAAGRDLVVSAQTGSGKTVAFGLAMAPDMLGDMSGNSAQMAIAQAPLALIIAPTRELALQVSRELTWLYAAAGARIATCVGGMDASKERRALRNIPHIVVGTPGRLRDHLERGALDLSALTTIVLDEADEMLDMGFREDLEEILDATPEQRRTLLFSATIPPQIAKLAKRYQKDALRISTVGEDRGHGDISYQAMTVSPSEIERAVVNLLRFHEAETAMLFCATRDNVRRLHSALQERGFGVVALSGEHSQQERNQALQALRDRRARVCVATDVASRGIDLPTLSLVIHVEIPRDAQTLQHRSGRTGRAGKKGTAVLVVPYTRRKRVASMLRGAKIEADWIEAPTPESIKAQDRERLLSALMAPGQFDDEDRALAERLMAEREPADIAAALVQAHRAAMPQPEEMLPNTPEARQADKQDRQRPGFEDIVWFKMDVGRKQNAEARWILPLLCRRGHITRNEIGAIRIGQEQTHFQVPRAVADKFTAALERTADSAAEDGSDIPIAPAPEGPPPQQHRGGPRRGGPGGGHGGGHGGGGKKPFVRGKPKPGGKPFGKGGKPGAPFKGKGGGDSNDAGGEKPGQFQKAPFKKAKHKKPGKNAGKPKHKPKPQD
ncbi:RNA helicase [Alteripontixanthobacter maritimus]|uniref:RNA helicase n=1 Tax=Alteripontixanthobacter maritimus TaxID=2161824 RepID=A0A369QC86_9SPHN|nr:DEAD/DEAH box helicase [Alteripontixanthobacter maritimus]RDC60847.1 RNA helicase [Alteripontixanthobacter maritimus]